MTLYQNSSWLYYRSTQYTFVKHTELTGAFWVFLFFVFGVLCLPTLPYFYQNSLVPIVPCIFSHYSIFFIFQPRCTLLRLAALIGLWICCPKQLSNLSGSYSSLLFIIFLVFNTITPYSNNFSQKCRQYCVKSNLSKNC